MAGQRGIIGPACEDCEVGSYQSDAGQIACIVCPDGKSTIAPRSTNLNQCLGMLMLNTSTFHITLVLLKK